jgi:hypothetical protein
MKRWRRRNSAVTVLKLQEWGKREAVGVVRTGGVSPPFIGAGGWWGRQWPGINGQLQGD